MILHCSSSLMLALLSLAFSFLFHLFSSFLVQDMPSVVVQSNEMEPAQGGGEKMAVTVNINMCPSFSGLGNPAKWLFTKIKPVGKIFKVEQTTCGIVQLLLGVLCLASGALIFSSTDWGNYSLQGSRIIMTGAPFWNGALFLVSGVISIISEKRPTRCWVLLALLMNLISICAAIPGMVFCAEMLTYVVPYYDNYYYDSCSYYGSNINYSDPLYHTLNSCRDKKNHVTELFKKVYANHLIMLIIIISLELCITLYSVGYSLKTMCCGKSSEQEDNVVLAGSASESNSESNILRNKLEFQSLLDI
ncbi:membrane-spanning 4-domains subfamily A member 3-like [Rhinatrema bivittatum]|uniref:membrane-spanning 4-domains subfamily A member 3-like n=1 Tax=Rhinatrema bivittatum TaxID=194408 RepID=UPI00112CF718|nr:membrane-spanning 4-domains subfamily A member 3-like [Rhinatrema bivittatum]